MSKHRKIQKRKEEKQKLKLLKEELELMQTQKFKFKDKIRPEAAKMLSDKHYNVALANKRKSEFNERKKELLIQ